MSGPAAVNRFELLMRFDPAGLHAAAKSWHGLANATRSAGTRHRSQVDGPLRQMHWQGKDAETAFWTMRRTEEMVEIVRVEAAAIALTLNTVADRMYQAQTNLKNAVQRAQEWSLTVGPDGTVNPPKLSFAEAHDPGELPERKAQLDQCKQLQQRIDKALSDAQAASDKGKEVLENRDPGILTQPRVFGAVAATAGVGDAVEKALGLDGLSVPDNTDPQKAAAWWKTLTPDQQADFIALHPGRIGAMDGLPSAVRDEANRLSLDQQLDKSEAGHARESNLTSEEYNKQQAGLRALRDRLAEQDGAPEGKQLFLLGLDPNGHGHAIVSMGNPDTADHTAVVVPGTDTTIASMPREIKRIDATQEAASDACQGTKKVAVISWLGYDAPEIPPENFSVADTDRAKDGAAPMRQFTEGLRIAQGDHHSHLTVIGHSYGTTAVGAAASGGAGLGADDIIALASPGMIVPDAGKLHISTDHVWVGTANDDPIRFASGLTLGRDPRSDVFGGHNIQIDTSGHSGYWDEGSITLMNQGRIIVGADPLQAPKKIEGHFVVPPYNVPGAGGR
ncbi:alpha/beta hydrolase [Kitasatospora sp. NPDC051170]|uniref:alpha/beta hydrolase n=1 Tax=Kitasatospora sp. NPDC051170 TaxID=3364056 RepID=UPI003793D455